jgi:hypothetical protein
MPSSAMLRGVIVVRADVSEQRNASISGQKESASYELLRLLATANVVPNSPILGTLIMEALRSSDTSVLTRVTRRYIPGDDILHSHRRENLKSCDNLNFVMNKIFIFYCHLQLPYFVTFQKLS